MISTSKSEEVKETVMVEPEVVELPIAKVAEEDMSAAKDDQTDKIVPEVGLSVSKVVDEDVSIAKVAECDLPVAKVAEGVQQFLTKIKPGGRGLC